jgi:hypothetical protein
MPSFFGNREPNEPCTLTEECTAEHHDKDCPARDKPKDDKP